MSLAPLDTLPEDSRLWCFGASRALEDGALQSVVDSMSWFIEEWTAHRRDLRAGFDVLLGRFMVVAVDESVTGASGCSLDALMRQLRKHAGVQDTDVTVGDTLCYFPNEFYEMCHKEFPGVRK